MQQESGGAEQAVSPVGAMGLMQVMPGTYQDLRARYGLGDDPFEPHSNILAGTAYIREMYDRFGAPGFLAGYNAGPDRVDAYLTGAASLPDETVNYLAAVTPNLGDSVPLSGPFATYASARPGAGARAYPGIASLAAGCDLNAAYDPNRPCTTLMRAATEPAPVQQAVLPQTGAGGCNLDAAYDPDHPCTSVGENRSGLAAFATRPSSDQQAAAGSCDLNAAYDPGHPCTAQGQVVAGSAAPPPRQPSALTPSPPMPAVRLASADGCDPNAAFNPGHPCHTLASATEHVGPSPTAASPIFRPKPAPDYLPTASGGWRAAGPEAHMLAMPARDWGIQVGAFVSAALARAVAEGARAEASGQLRDAAIALPQVTIGNSVLYRARLVNLSESAAANACTNLNRRQLPCVVVQPNRS